MTGREQEHHIATQVHGCYLVAAPDGKGPFPLLVGFHGYGETARDHLPHLRRIAPGPGWLSCAVQGLHPFYRRSGEVVAGWMTRFDRERAIRDNLRYVAGVVTQVGRDYPVAGRPVYVGFSQGVAMAYRAAAASGQPGRGLIALAGDVPPELAEGDLSHLPPVLVGRGHDEEWYTEERLRADLERLAAGGVAVEVCRFPGGHEWTEEFYRACHVYLEGL